MLGQPISMLIPEVIGFKLTGKLQRRRHRHRPRAHRHRDAAQEGRGRQVRRVLRRRPLAPVARGQGDHRQHGAGIRRHLRLLPGRQGHARLPEGDRPRRPSASRWSRPMPRRRACSAPTTRPTRCSPTRSSSTSPRSSPRSPARSGRRTACRFRPPTPPSRRRPRQDARPQRRRQRLGHGRGRRRLGAEPLQDRIRRREGLPARRRRRGHRRDHLVHQHLQPERADRRRAARPQRPRQGADLEAVGEDVARAGLAGGHRLSRKRRPAGRPRRARLQPRRLRLHHLHRQFRPAARGDFRRDQQARIWSSPRSFPATATSRAASIRTRAPTTSPRRRWSSPTR